MIRADAFARYQLCHLHGMMPAPVAIGTEKIDGAGLVIARKELVRLDLQG